MREEIFAQHKPWKWNPWNCFVAEGGERYWAVREGVGWFPVWGLTCLQPGASAFFDLANHWSWGLVGWSTSEINLPPTQHTSLVSTSEKGPKEVNGQIWRIQLTLKPLPNQEQAVVFARTLVLTVAWSYYVTSLKNCLRVVEELAERVSVRSSQRGLPQSIRLSIWRWLPDTPSSTFLYLNTRESFHLRKRRMRLLILPTAWWLN